MKHVEFYSKNKFEKSARLFGFVIRIYHDALLPERQNSYCYFASKENSFAAKDDDGDGDDDDNADGNDSDSISYNNTWSWDSSFYERSHICFLPSVSS
jgi:hypothetical protein